MSMDRITFDPKRKFFVFNGQFGYSGRIVVDKTVAYVNAPLNEKDRCFKFTAKVVGKLIGQALIQGANRVQFGSVAVSVNYLTQMLAFVGKHGWFSDLLSSTADHNFDPNHPTPGGFVGEARRLQAEAADLERYARLARTAHREDEAKPAEENAAQLRATARRMLTEE